MIGTEYFKAVCDNLGYIRELHKENKVIQAEIKKVEAHVENLLTMHKVIDAEFTTTLVK